MSLRRQVSVSDELWSDLRALEFVTKRPQGKVVQEAIRAMLERDEDLAAKVEQAKKAAA